jgi:rod shape determining protein RodA
VGMVTGLLPVVGIPLVLFSYGGSSLVTTMTVIGLLMNIRMRRFMFQ